MKWLGLFSCALLIIMEGHASWDAISLRRIKAACDSKDGCKRGGMAMLLLRLELSFASLNDIF